MATTTLPEASRPDPGFDAGDALAPAAASAVHETTVTHTLPIAAAIAAAASVGAGLVHVAAAGSHNGDRSLSLAFAFTAVAQLGVAAAYAAHRRRSLITALVVLNVAALQAWAYTRVRGVSFVSGLEEAQNVDLADASAAAFEAIAVAAGLFALLRAGKRAVRPAWGTALVAVAMLAAVPGMASPHDHTDANDTTVAAGDDHRHGTGGAGDDTAAKADPNVVLGVRLPPVDGVTEAQKKAAAQLILDTKKGLERFPTVDAVIAAGYRSIGDGFTGFEHFVHAGYLVNPNVLNPAEPESLVYKVLPDGSKQLASAMYILPIGQTMANVPDVAGPMTVWHDHQNLCWDDTGVRLAGVLQNGKCVPGGTFRPTPPMLHVWVTEHPCGPFAGIEGSSHTGACHPAGDHHTS